MRGLRRFLATLALACFLASAGEAQNASREGEPVGLDVHPVTFDRSAPERTRFGQLEWRGGVEIVSDAAWFGGLSGVEIVPGGDRMIAVTDAGYWFSAGLRLEGGHLVGLEDGRLAPILDAAGSPMREQDMDDAEAIAWADGSGVSGRVVVAYERANLLFGFDLGGGGFLAPATARPELPGREEIRWNKGLEAAAILPPGGPRAGALVAISERGPRADPRPQGWLVDGDEVVRFRVKRTENYDVTDAAGLPSGCLLLLERRFDPLRGPAARIRRIPVGAIREGAEVDGSVLFEADRRFTIDNMEGLAVSRGERGETILTLVSDDNFHLLQRTLVLRFALEESFDPPRMRGTITP